jgi:hypothetical protein
MPPPPNPKPARSVLVTTEATVAWLPLEEGPIPVAMETNEKGMPEDVQVEDPELMGAMSAEEAGEAVGCIPRKDGEETGGKSRMVSVIRIDTRPCFVKPQRILFIHPMSFSKLWCEKLPMYDRSSVTNSSFNGLTITVNTLKT